MNAEVKMVTGLTFVGKASSGHWVPMDGTSELGGADAAARPLELFLIGLGGCTGMDVVSILTKKRMPPREFWIEIQSERAAQHPKIFTRIHMVYHVAGAEVTAEAVAEAVRLSQEKYCPAYAILTKSCPVTSAYAITP